MSTEQKSRKDQLLEKWNPVLDIDTLPKITDRYKRLVTAAVLENQEKSIREEGGAVGMLGEAAPTNNIGAGNISTFDPIMISLVRRALPNLMHYDLAGLQPMTGPTGLIFAMRSRYGNQSGGEAFFNEANTAFSGWGSYGNTTAVATDVINDPLTNLSSNTAFTTGQGMATAFAETLGDGSNLFPEMSFTIDKISVTAKTRAMKAEYTLELAQDLKAIHGLDAETELANILTTELLTEMNREIIRTIYYVAIVGAQVGTASAGTFNLDVDSNGRWSMERFKGLIYHIERECNGIAKDTRRGKGNIAIVSSDVASALAMTGLLTYTPNLSAPLQVDDTGNTYAGMLNNRIKIYIDPYFGGSSSNHELCVVGYKGSNPYDAGLFYCPYVPLQMVRAVGQDTFQPKIGFKTRYGLVANPFAEGLNQGNGLLNVRANKYYRIFSVANIM